MKTNIKLSALACLFAVAAVSCSQQKTAETKDQAIRFENEAAYQQAIADRDTLISLMSEINDGIMQIKALENIITVNTDETVNLRQQIINDIRAIQLSIASREERLAALEAKLNSSNANNATLQKTIASLRSQIEQQQSAINKLTGELGIATETIAAQSAQIDTLNAMVQTVSTDLEESQQANVDLTNKMNECYYVIGSNKELKEHKILEKKFLRSTKVMQGDFDQSYFTTGDKRMLKVIPLNVKKAEVKTGQPATSYELRKADNGTLELVILNPDRFWEVTDYLVIEVK